MGKRQELPRAQQRTRSDHRQPGRHAGIQDSEAPDSEENHRPAGVHDRTRRRLFLSSRHQGPSLPRGTEQRKDTAMSASKQPGRTYNQNHVPRPYTPGKRRFSIYWTWSYPWEANRDLAELDNRFSTMTEVRRVAWPSFEGREWDKMNFLQGIAGTLELFHRSTLAFQQIVGETTGHPVP